MIAEFRVIPENISTLDINGAENFLSSPFLYVSSANDFQKTIQSFNDSGKVQVYWTRKGEGDWLTNSYSSLDIRYDGLIHNYKLILPAGGEEIDKVKLSDIKLPGALMLYSFSYNGLNFKNLIK